MSACCGGRRSAHAERILPVSPSTRLEAVRDVGVEDGVDGLVRDIRVARCAAPANGRRATVENSVTAIREPVFCSAAVKVRNARWTSSVASRWRWRPTRRGRQGYPGRTRLRDQGCPRGCRPHRASCGGRVRARRHGEQQCAHQDSRQRSTNGASAPDPLAIEKTVAEHSYCPPQIRARMSTAQVKLQLKREISGYFGRGGVRRRPRGL